MLVVTEPVASLLANQPPPRQVDAAEVTRAVLSSGRQLVVLDDDPTGTQTVAGVPVLTRWGVEDLRWALDQRAPAVYVLTNTRSLAPDVAAERNREVMAALADAAAAAKVDYVVASRSDSTLRGHFPLEVDVLLDALRETRGIAVDGVVLAPAYVEGGRITVDSQHWLRTASGFVPVAESEFARDATFGYASSDLRAYVEEKTNGRWKASAVEAIGLKLLRVGGVEAVAARLAKLGGGRPVVVDAACDDDLRVLSLALLQVEAAGRTFLYRVGPSFVRARAGLEARPPLRAEELASLTASAPAPRVASRSPHGLVVVGSHVRQTSRQLERLRHLEGTAHIELDVAALLESGDSTADLVAMTNARAREALITRDVVVSTSRKVITGADAEASLSVAREVSRALAAVVQAITATTSPRWIIAKGGITSSDVATEGLAITRAWVRGTMLPGIVSLWQPVTGALPGVPYVVFAGNVGDDAALVDVVVALRGAR